IALPRPMLLQGFEPADEGVRLGWNVGERLGDACPHLLQEGALLAQHAGMLLRFFPPGDGWEPRAHAPLVPDGEGALRPQRAPGLIGDIRTIMMVHMQTLRQSVL